MDETTKRRLSRWTLQAAARELMGSESVAFCLRRIVPVFHDVHVCFSGAAKRAHYKHLFICASVWMCPVCAAKISEYRRVELSQAIENNKNLVTVLVTFTLQHTRGDKLPLVLAAMLAAYKRLKTGRWWSEFQKRHCVVGSIRGLEVTFGENAWHPHLHVLAFLEKRCARSFETELKTRWSEVLLKEKRGASYARGVTVQFADGAVASYVSKLGAENVTVHKWTLSHELAKTPVKVSKSERGKTPMQLLAEFVNGNKKSGYRWREYALAFKGKRQLVWSRGLRSRLGIGKDASDAEVVAREDETAVLLARLTLAQWRVVLGNDARGEVLEVASSGDAAELWSYLRSLGVKDAEV